MSFPEDYSFERIVLNASDFVAGPDDDTSLTAGTVGDIAEMEVNNDGQAASYDYIALGAVHIEGDFKDKLFMKLQSGGSDVADTVQFRLVAKPKNGNRTLPLTNWVSHRNQDNADPRQRNALSLREPYVKRGRLIVLQVKDETASVTADLSESAFEIPAQGAY